MIKEGTSLVSVIIPCYNVELYVEQAINSIINQTYKNLEIWIIDDASTDDTLQKINAIKDERIKVFACRNNTQKIGAVNEVLTKATGDFIAFQDADDWSEPERIAEQVKEFMKDPALGICFTGFDFVRNKKHFNSKRISKTSRELKDEFLNYNRSKVDGTTATTCATMMITREVLKKTGGYNLYFKGRVAEDVHWIYRILKDFEGITLNKCLYHYRLIETSFTGMQAKGVNPKYAYSWHLLTKIIHKDVHEGIDILAPENSELLKSLELEACEEALVENIQLANHTRHVYENSTNFKMGKFLLVPIRGILKTLKV